MVCICRYNQNIVQLHLYLGWPKRIAILYRVVVLVWLKKVDIVRSTKTVA